MITNFLIEVFKKKGLIYSEHENWVGKTYIFETKVKDPVYGTVATTKTISYEPTDIAKEVLIESTQIELLSTIIQYGKDSMISALLKRLEKLN